MENNLELLNKSKKKFLKNQVNRPTQGQQEEKAHVQIRIDKEEITMDWEKSKRTT